MPFDPFSVGAGIAGIGFDIAGGIISMGAARKEAHISKQIAEKEVQQSSIRQQTMNNEAQKMSLDELRREQQARSYARSGAQQSGAQLGSGLGGVIGGISGQANTNLSGISYNQQQGNAMFGLSNEISGLKMQYADAQSQGALGSGLTSFGNNLLGVAKIV